MISAPAEFHQLLDAAPDAMIVVDHQGLVTALNVEAERFLGWAEQELLGEPMMRLFPRRFHRLLESDLETNGGSPAASTTGVTLSCFAQRRDGTEFPVALARRAFGPGSEAQSLVTLRDLTQWRRAQDSRSRKNERAHATLESMGDAVITTDHAGMIKYINPAAERVTGWALEEAVEMSLDAVLPLISEATRQPVSNTAARCLEEGRSVDLEDGVLLLRRDGTEVPIGDSAAPVRDRSGTTIGVVLVLQDESEKRRVGHRLSYEATHDAMTGLVNRREFERRLARVLADLAGAAAEHVLLSLDLDHFKLVNDTCGHEAGDDLLRRLGALLSRHMRKRDTLARLGGDEFGVILENCPLGEANRIAENIRGAIELYRFEWEGRAFSIGASIGLLPVTAKSGGMATVLRSADAACYAAKHAGGNRVHLERPGADSIELPQAKARLITQSAHAENEGCLHL
jgi:diguanylate cyclase (GGDEF)-like protein/PAS domain S-box-containing protein